MTFDLDIWRAGHPISRSDLHIEVTEPSSRSQDNNVPFSAIDCRYEASRVDRD